MIRPIIVAPFHHLSRHEQRGGSYRTRMRCVARLRACVIAALVCGSGAALPARANCFDDAAAYQHVNPLILRAIAWQESRNQPGATHLNANGSTDYGVMQINSIHLATLSRYGIARDALMSPCKNIYIAAWQLRRQIVKYGNTWAAVGAYHSATPALRDGYARQIAAILRRWNMLPDERAASPGIERVSATPRDMRAAQTGVKQSVRGDERAASAGFERVSATSRGTPAAQAGMKQGMRGDERAVSEGFERVSATSRDMPAAQVGTKQTRHADGGVMRSACGRGE
ncbi:hypothetical protein J2794_004720 [Paraburkholderia terricola]|nr:hypothetical protein [Paraburkholderia terricola]